MRQSLAPMVLVSAFLSASAAVGLEEEPPVSAPIPSVWPEEEKAFVDGTFYTGTLNWYWQAGGSSLSMRGYTTSANGGTVTQVTACLYNESAFTRTFNATASVVQGSSTIQSIPWQRSYPPSVNTCHTLTGFDATVEPGAYAIAVSYDKFDAENLFLGLPSTDSGQTFDVQVGSARPPVGTGPQGPIPMRGVGIRYRINENDAPPPPPPGCIPDGETLCLVNGRFKVELAWETNTDSGVGQARTIPGVDFSGLFWFFNSDNLEMLVKVLDACGLNQKFWVFYAATTNVGFDMTITDTATGVEKVYRNSRGVAAPPVQDTEAFSCAGLAP